MFIFNYLSLIKCAAAHYCPKIVVIVISIIAILLIVIVRQIRKPKIQETSTNLKIPNKIVIRLLDNIFRQNRCEAEGLQDPGLDPSATNRYL